MAVGLLSMGLLQGFHPFARPGFGFVLLHSVSCFLGGFWFALVWLPEFNVFSPARKWIPWLVAAGSVLLGVWILLFRETMPLMVENGRFTQAAILLNLLAGVLFLAAAGRFIRDFLRSDNTAFFIFSCIALLFGLSNLSFPFSAVFNSTWWYWHLLRVLAYLLALWFVFDRDQKTILALRSTMAEWERGMKSIRKSEERCQTIFDHTGDAIFIHDMNGKMLEVNRIACERLGFSREELLQMTLIDIDSPKYAELVPERMHQLMTKNHHIFETCHVRKDKSSIPIEVSGRVIEHEGRPAILSIARDITERKRAEETLRESDAELRQKNAELERFIYTLSHDLKSPLVTINAFMGYLEQDLADNNTERIERDMDFVRKAADKMSVLLNELLELSRVGLVVNAPVHVTFQELAAEALNAVAGGIAEKKVDVQVADVYIVLYGDRLRLAEIWQNLIENAVKYMGDQKAPRIDIGVEIRDQDTVFMVRDNGMGIDPRYREKVFKLFEKLDPNSEGTGLGLALVRRIVGLYGGVIWVESQGSGLGACFCFTLPKALGKNMLT